MDVPVTLFGIALTVTVYAASRTLARKYPSPFTTPVFFSTALIIATLSAIGLTPDDYVTTKEILVFPLGPATVALAVPLYKNRRLLAAHALPAFIGILVGSIATVLAAIGLATLFGLSSVVVASMSLKSVTAPIAIEIAEILGGSLVLTAGFVIATGMIGAMFGPWLMNFAGIHHPIARGLALGTVSHGQGTAQAVLEGEIQGAMAGIAMGLAAVLTSFAAPWVASLLN